MTRNVLALAAMLALTATALPAQEETGQSAGSSGQAGQSQSSQSGQAQSGQAQSEAQSGAQSAQNTITASMLQDATVVSLEGQYKEDVWQDRAPLSTMVADLTEIGHVQDIVLSARGEVQGLTIDVGGFLGIGTKAVLIPLPDLRLARPDPESDEITVVTRLNQQQLNELPEYEMQE